MRQCNDCGEKYKADTTPKKRWKWCPACAKKRKEKNA